MKKIILTLLVAYGAYHWYSTQTDDLAGNYGVRHNDLIMYSLTTCGFCKQKRSELQQEKIAFKEYFIDTDSKRMNELNDKLKKAGFKPKSYGTPIFDVHGIMLPNNPKLSLIREKME